LRQYKFKIIYILSKENRKVDILSRKTDITETKLINKAAIFKQALDSTLKPAHSINFIIIVY
ncbi:hypothetical protein BS50DRAFT_505574, partial [Corynespora cassiicola Philippines]